MITQATHRNTQLQQSYLANTNDQDLRGYFATHKKCPLDVSPKNTPAHPLIETSSMVAPAVVVASCC